MSPDKPEEIAKFLEDITPVGSNWGQTPLLRSTTLKPSRTKPKQPIVAHPRYGAESVPSGFCIPHDQIRSSHWRHDLETIYPHSAIPADATKQNYSIYPRSFYVDVLKQCRLCGRRFIFFAKEQKHWFEVLQFWIDADCVHCPECRQKNQTIKRRLVKYSALAKQAEKNQKEWEALVDVATFLFSEGVLRDTGRLGKLKNEAKRHAPAYPGTEHLGALLKKARGSIVKARSPE